MKRLFATLFTPLSAPLFATIFAFFALIFAPAAPAAMLLKDYDGRDLSGWLASEKFDGVRALWDGERLVSRQGVAFAAPRWWLAGLPPFALDGELFVGRGEFERTASIVRRGAGGAATPNAGTAWRDVRYKVFDAPTQRGGIVARLGAVQAWLDGFLAGASGGADLSVGTGTDFAPNSNLGAKNRLDAGKINGDFAPNSNLRGGENSGAGENFGDNADGGDIGGGKNGAKFSPIDIVAQIPLNSTAQAFAMMEQIVQNGGEGLAVRSPSAAYENARSDTILKLKPFHDSECEVVELFGGRGRLAGRLGAVLCRDIYSGVEFRLGGGFSDEIRAASFANASNAAKKSAQNSQNSPTFATPNSPASNAENTPADDAKISLTGNAKISPAIAAPNSPKSPTQAAQNAKISRQKPAQNSSNSNLTHHARDLQNVSAQPAQSAQNPTIHAAQPAQPAQNPTTHAAQPAQPAQNPTTHAAQPAQTTPQNAAQNPPQNAAQTPPDPALVIKKGDILTYKFTSFTKNKKPRFPRFWRKFER